MRFRTFQHGQSPARCPQGQESRRGRGLSILGRDLPIDVNRRAFRSMIFFAALLAACTYRHDGADTSDQTPVRQMTRPAVKSSALLEPSSSDIAPITPATMQAKRYASSTHEAPIKRPFKQSVGFLSGSDSADDLSTSGSSGEGAAETANETVNALPPPSSNFETTSGTSNTAAEDGLSSAEPTGLTVRLWHDAIVGGTSFFIWLIPLLLTLLAMLLLRWMAHRRTSRRVAVPPRRTPKITLATAADEEPPAPAAIAIPMAAVVPAAAAGSEPQPVLAWSNEKQNFDQWNDWYFAAAGDISPSLIPFVLKHSEAKAIRTVWDERPGVLPRSMTVADELTDAPSPAITPSQEPALPAPILPAPAAIAIEETASVTLLDRLESLALAADASQPAFFIEGTEPLPGIACPAPLSQPLLDELETVLLDAMRQREPCAEWLLLQVLMMRMARAGKAEIDSIYVPAVELTQHGLDHADNDEKARWQA